MTIFYSNNELFIQKWSGCFVQELNPIENADSTAWGTVQYREVSDVLVATSSDHARSVKYILTWSVK